MSSPDQEQDINSGPGINDLPADLRRQTAAWVDHGSLPALRLVSRAWNEAANLAVRRLTGPPPKWPAQLQLIGLRWPNIEQLNLGVIEELWSPDRNCRALILSLRPVKRLQHLRLDLSAALLPEGQELLLRQTGLLGLHLWRNTFGMIDGASDRLLQVIGRLNSLTRLDCHLQDRAYRPTKLEPATDEGMRCLSSLQFLQDLRLTVNRLGPAVTGQALSTIGGLRHLTHLCLSGWPMLNTDLGYLTHLQLRSLDLSNCLHLTSACLLHEMLLFKTLHSLYLGQGHGWTAEQLEAFKEQVLARDMVPFFRVVSF